MKLHLSLLALPMLMLACEAGTTTPPAARIVTPTQVSSLAARTRTELAPRLVEAIHALDNSSFLSDLELDVSGLPPSREVADALAPYLDAIFAESSIESNTGAEITYLLPAARVCDGDAECVRVFTQHPVRFVVSSPVADRLHVAVDVGASRLRALVLDVAPDALEIDVDLAQARLMLVEWAPELDVEVAALPTGAGGFLHLAATPHALAFSSRGGAHLDGAVDGTPYHLALGDSRADLDFDGAGGTVIGTVDLGAIAVNIPFGWFGARTVCDANGDCVTEEAEGQIQYALAGLEGRVSFDANADALVIDDLGLGGAPLTVSLDGATQVTADFNALQSRTVDLSIRYLRQELEIAVSPMIEATVDLSMGAIAAQADVAAWLVNDHLRARFDGATSPTLRYSLDNGFVRVVSGNFSLSSDSNTLTAGVDQCIAAREEVPAGGGVVESLMSYPCE